MGCTVGKMRRWRPNQKIASWKVLSTILWCGAIKAVLDRNEPSKGSCRLLPRTVLEALHEHIATLCWKSASRYVPKIGRPRAGAIIPTSYSVLLLFLSLLSVTFFSLY
jgi:hypothetical protein